MATFKTDYRTTQENNPRALSILDKEVTPRLHKVKYTIPASGFAVNDSIEVLAVPKGTIVLPISSAHVEALGASTTLRMGKSVASTSLVGDTDTSSDVNVFLDASPETREMDFDGDGENIIYANIRGAAPTAGQEIIFYLYLANAAI